LQYDLEHVTPVVSGGLFPDSFLETFRRGVSTADSDALLIRLKELLESFTTSGSPNEAHTEDDLIWPTLHALGWTEHLRQQNLSPSGRSVVPDGILFSTKEDKARANKRDRDFERYNDGICIVESKRWGRPLDRKGKGEDDTVTPSFQILNYLSRVGVVTDERVRWGILTNGRIY